MGLFGKTSEIAKAKDIYAKAQRGTLKARLLRTNQPTKNCVIRLDKDINDDYYVLIKADENENFIIKLSD